MNENVSLACLDARCATNAHLSVKIYVEKEPLEHDHVTFFFQKMPVFLSAACSLLVLACYM